MAFIRNIPIDNLLLDNQNPRFPIELQNKMDIEKKQDEIIKYMRENFHLEDLADSLNENGFLPTEAIIVIPIKELDENTSQENFEEKITEQLDSQKFIVVEGNRRLSTVRLLQNKQLAESLRWKIEGSEKIIADTELPCFIMRSRNEVSATLGVKHIVGVLKWEAKEKAAYIYDMYMNLSENDRNNNGLDELQKKLGVAKTDSIRKSLYAYIWLKILNENEENQFKDFSENRFSYLVLAIGQSGIKDFLGMERSWRAIDFNNISQANHKHPQYEKFKDLCEVLSDTEIVKESRYITSHLSRIYTNEDAVLQLKMTRNLDTALLYVNGEQEITKEFFKIVTKLDSIKNTLWSRVSKESRKKIVEEYIVAIEKTLQTFKND